MTDEKHIPQRTSDGKFPKGVSGNPLGRPKGSKNRITVLKLALEQATREQNMEKMAEVINLVVAQALSGCEKSQKLVWDSIMSKAASSEDKSAGQKQRIEIGVMNVDNKGSKPIEGEVIDVETTEEIPNGKHE